MRCAASVFLPLLIVLSSGCRPTPIKTDQQGKPYLESQGETYTVRTWKLRWITPTQKMGL